MCQVSANTSVGCFDVGVSSSSSNKIICSFLVHLLLVLAIETLNVNDNMILKVGQVSPNIIIGCFDVDVPSSPSNKTICSCLVCVLLRLAIETCHGKYSPPNFSVQGTYLTENDRTPRPVKMVHNQKN